MAITLKVQILGITKPPCWRRIVVPNDITFLDLHYAIQDAFGWSGDHLWCFHPTKYVSVGWRIKPSFEDDFFDDDSLPTSLTLFDVPFGKKFCYTYDFGDRWVHSVTPESVDDKPVESPVIIAEKGEAPEEDCGGVAAWMWLRDHPEEREDGMW